MANNIVAVENVEQSNVDNNSKDSNKGIVLTQEKKVVQVENRKDDKKVPFQTTEKVEQDSTDFEILVGKLENY